MGHTKICRPYFADFQSRFKIILVKILIMILNLKIRHVCRSWLVSCGLRWKDTLLTFRASDLRVCCVMETSPGISLRCTLQLQQPGIRGPLFPAPENLVTVFLGLCFYSVCASLPQTSTSSWIPLLHGNCLMAFLGFSFHFCCQYWIPLCLTFKFLPSPD